jgi:nucleotide-binding universal stress UspA family protein
MIATISSRISLAQIVIATDLSDASSNATNYAKVFAKRYASHVVLVHACQPYNPLAIPERGGTASYSQQKAEEQMEMRGAELRSEGFSAVSICAYGPVESEILSLAKVHHADLVVLGTQGRQGLARLLFGSKAEAVARRSDCPVLAVGPAAAARARSARVPKQILCATSLNVHSAKVAAYGYQLAEDNGAAFTLFHVEDPSHSASPKTWRAFEDAFQRALTNGHPLPPPIQKLFSSDNPAKGIVQAAAERQADLIVLGAKHAAFGITHFHQGVLPQVLTTSPCPVLAIPSH